VYCTDTCTSSLLLLLVSSIVLLLPSDGPSECQAHHNICTTPKRTNTTTLPLLLALCHSQLPPGRAPSSASPMALRCLSLPPSFQPADFLVRDSSRSRSLAQRRECVARAGMWGSMA
jgi:hypothetical protein